MNYARRTARRQALRQQRRSVAKNQFRRGLMAERLEERSLLAADLGFHSEGWNIVKPSDVNADGIVAPGDALVVINSLNSRGSVAVSQLGGEGESGASTKYYMDVNNDGFVSPADALKVINDLNGEGEGPPLVLYSVDQVATASSTTAINTIRGGQDFYVRVRARDIRSPAVSPAGVYAAYMDLQYDKSLFTLAINEVQSITLPDFTPNGSFTLSKDGGVTKTATINFDTSDSSITQEAAIQTALNAYLTNPVTVVQDPLNPVHYLVTFSSNKDINVNEPQLTSDNVAVTTDTIVQGDPAAAGVVDEVQTISLPANTTGSFTLSNDGGATQTSAINFDTTGAASQATAIQTALNAYLPHPVVVARDPVNPLNYSVTFSDPADSNQDQPQLVSNNAAVTTSETAKGGAGFSLAIIYSSNYRNGKSGNVASNPDRFDELGAFFSGDTSTGVGVGSVEVLRIHMLALTPSGTTQTAFTPVLDNPDSTSALLSPAHDTLMLGRNAAVPHDQITLSFTTLTVTSGPINAVADTGQVDEDTAAGVTINVIGNDTKNAGAPAGAIQLVSPQTFTVSPTGAGTVTATDANNVKFVPASNFSGTATFTYQAQIVGDSNPDDIATGNVTVTVNAVNDAPTVIAPSAQSGSEDVALPIGGVSVADVDADAAATNPGLAVTVTAQNGKIHVATSPAAIVGNDSGSVTITGLVADVNTALAGLTYTGNQNYNGPDSVVVTANDNGNTGKGGALQASKTIAITVAAVNDAPVNQINGQPVDINNAAQSQLTTPGVALHFNASGTNQLSVGDVDALATDSLTTTLSVGAGQGTLHVQGTGIPGNDTSSVTISGTIAQINAALTDVVYTPADGFVSTATLTMATNDNGHNGSGGAQSSTTANSTITIKLDPGVRPFAVLDRYSFAEGTTGDQPLPVLANDFTSLNATSTFISAITQPAEGTIAISADQQSLIYTPPSDPDFFTPVNPLTFTYTIDDDDPDSIGSNPDGTSTGTVSITITNVADAPVAVNDNFGTAIGVALPADPLRNVLSNDKDVDNNYGKSDVAILSVLGAPKTIVTSGGGSVTIAADGTFAYTPAAAFLGDDTFTYQAVSNLLTGTPSNAATVKIHVSSPPVVSNSAATAQEDTPLNIDISGNYTDPTESRPLGSVEIVANVPAAAGAVTLATGNKSFIYTPAANFNTTRPPVSPITFTYIARASDGTPSNTATVSITVNEVNDNPTAVNDTFLGVKKQAGGVGVDQPVLKVLNNDSIAPDVDETLKVTAVNGAVADASGNAGPVATSGGGSVRLANFQILYTSPTVTGSDSFTYTASDFDATTGAARGGSATASVNVNVVDFVPKTLSGVVSLDKGSAGKYPLAGVQVTLTGVDFLNNPISLTATTDSTGKYVFPQAAGQPGVPSSDPNDFLKPPKEGTTYTVTESQPKYLGNGVATYNAAIDDPSNVKPDPTPDSANNLFTVGWAVTDTSGNLGSLNFSETGVDATSLTNANGFITELFSTSSQDGLIFGTHVGVSQPMWTMQLGTTWALASGVQATLDPSLAKLTLVVADGNGGHTVTLYQDPRQNTGALAGSMARFRILGIGQNDEYIIRVDATAAQCGLTLALPQVPSEPEGEGEGLVDGNYSQAADAVFGNWA